MKKICYIVFLIFLNCSCTNDYLRFSDVAREVGNIDSLGLKQGEWISYNHNNQVIIESIYLNDTLHGDRSTFFSNGILRSSVRYNKGVLVDTFKLFYDNGQISTIDWRDSEGNHQGVFKSFYRSGQIHQSGHFLDGRLYGTTKLYYENGQLKSLENFEISGFEGKSFYFKENGDTIKIIEFSNDTIIRQVDFN